jgi:transcriptional regulator with XRE-family HTH domain
MQRTGPQWPVQGAQIMDKSTHLLQNLNQRRQELGLSYRQLGRRSGVHPMTVKRIITSGRARPLLSSVVAIAERLGMAVVFVPKADPRTMKRAHAHQNARERVSLAQGASGPEAQAVD